MFLIVSLLTAFPSYGSSVRVVPTIIFLNGARKTDVLKVINDGDNKIALQVEAVRWTQGKGGKDMYEPTDEIVFFPKIFTIEKGRETLLRIGAKAPRSGASEGSYRIFLQEIPVSRPGDSRLTIALSLSIPVFISPAKAEREWSIDGVRLSRGGLLIDINNSGNSHIVVGKMKAIGTDISNKEVFQKESVGWYVLPGATRTFQIGLSPGECTQMGSVTVTAEVGEVKKEMKTDINTTLCGKGPGGGTSTGKHERRQ